MRRWNGSLRHCIKCKKEDDDASGGSKEGYEYVSVERPPYYSYMDSTSGRLQPASGSRASIPVSREKCFKQIQAAITKYREIKENINEGLKFYVTLQDAITNVKQQCSDFVLTLELENLLINALIFSGSLKRNSRSK